MTKQEQYSEPENNQSKAPKKGRSKLLDNVAPQFERFIESRETYIQALEKTITVVMKDGGKNARPEAEKSSSVDELVAMQRLADVIGTAVEPNTIVTELVDLTQQVIPVFEASIFLFDGTSKKLMPLTAHGSEKLVSEAQQQLESGIVDWILNEKKTVVIPDLSCMLENGSSRNYVLVPLMIRRKGIGVYLIYTEKKQEEFSNQDIQLLTVLANQAAVGVENWRTNAQLVKANNELKMFQAQMMQAAKLAAVGELAASIVHEIKNPVQIMLMQMDIVNSGQALPNWKETLEIQIQRLTQMTRRLMNFSRAVGEEYGNETVDINKEVALILDIIAHDYRNNHIEVVRHFEENLPTVQGSINHLQQVFLNILLNARDAMPKGGTMTVTTEVKNFKVYIMFTDSGTGISPENRAKLFTPFFTTKEAGKGTGLGLSTCHKIVSNHKGEITVESTEGVGTTFIIALPVRREIA